MENISLLKRLSISDLNFDKYKIHIKLPVSRLYCMWSESKFAVLDLRGMGRYDLAFAKNSLTILVKAFQKKKTYFGKYFKQECLSKQYQLLQNIL